VWREVLGHDNIGVTDNFFEVGGDSIQSLQVVSRARKSGWLVTTRQLFDHPTVEGLAGVVVSADEAGQAHIELHTPLPLTPIQAFFFEHRPDAPAHWNQSVLLRTPDGDLDAGHLGQALLAVVARHDALRLRFARDKNGEWVQQVAPSEDGRILEVVDLRESGENWKNHLREHGERLQASLNLGAGPVIRAGWFRLPDGSGRLLL
ncbi:PvdI, partial [Acetobacter senegalensis]|uniref:condensation domain-containing protein n=1 Tax=Acetobacter senegalensis TaxID=446692 RepID=UPI001EDC0972